MVPPVCDKLFPKVIELITESIVEVVEPVINLESIVAEPELIVELEPVVTEVVDLFFLDVITLAELELVITEIVELVVEPELK